MDVSESDVPGVGKKFEATLNSGDQITILTRYNGTRDVYKQTTNDGDATKLFTVTDQESRQLGTILEGAQYQPVETEQVAIPLGNATMEWITLNDTSPLAGETLHEANIRQRAGVSIIAVQRDDNTIPNPGPSFTLQPDDILVTLGDRDDHTQFEQIATKDE